MNTILKIKFMNWWSTGENDFFRLFIERYVGIKTTIVKDNPDILFFSVFHRECPIQYCKKTPSVKLKIFFTGEDTTSQSSRGSASDHYFLNFADISLGFKFINHKNYIRFPLWLTYINIEKYNMGKNCLPFSKLLNFCPNKKNKFCCLLSNHDTNNTRTSIVKELSKYKLVVCGGNIFTHDKSVKCIKESVSHGENSKQYFLKNYKFNICSESSISKGYISEKIFEAIIAGCIPIYFAKNNDIIEPEIINNDFLIKYNNNNCNTIVPKIIDIDSNINSFNNHVSISPLTNDAYEKIISYYDSLKYRILQFI